MSRCIFRSLNSPVQCQDCGLEISREDWDEIFERVESRQRTTVAVGIPVAASAVAAPQPRRNGFETVTHMGERVVFVPNLGLSSTRVPDADFWDAMDFYKSALKPLKKKFAMQLITLTYLTGIPMPTSAADTPLAGSRSPRSAKFGSRRSRSSTSGKRSRSTSLRNFRSPHSN